MVKHDKNIREITGDMEVSWYTKITSLNNNPLDSVLCVWNDQSFGLFKIVVQISDVAHGPRFGFSVWK